MSDNSLAVAFGGLGVRDEFPSTYRIWDDGPKPCNRDLQSHAEHEARKAELRSFYEQLKHEEVEVTVACAYFNVMLMAHKYNKVVDEYHEERQRLIAVDVDIVMMWPSVRMFARAAKRTAVEGVAIEDLDDQASIVKAYEYSRDRDFESLLAAVSHLFREGHLLWEARRALKSRIQILKRYREQLKIAETDHKASVEIASLRSRLGREQGQPEATLEHLLLLADHLSQLDLKDRSSVAAELFLDRLVALRVCVAEEQAKMEEIQVSECEAWNAVCNVLREEGRGEE
ncbi:uncharacterized protein K452DRAFT_310270 [Aplosporella prunicola CBS 121167]|uniref:Uncharacterized protein n=1 Tax=Aplosporella prunicola CBS 121167 TaxID=1176127 RepID=A0A6A6B8L1_9PEZI|nr:uncharacterized protein K452DRAFT_310270 [Aplosporella prunicola CBS 121167]KAF2139898.1 hypothetical protein K452DRAFT_310270 [Aplosporella prunicola CBS 121167]